MSDINRCAYLDKEHRFTIVEKLIPKPASDEVVVKIIANGICGSDIHFYHDGRLGNFVVDEPYIPGHESSGMVTDTGSCVTGLKAGDRVVVEPGIPCGRCDFCKAGRYNLCKSVVFMSAPPINGTFCDYITIRSDFVHKIPDSITFEQGALIEPTAVAVHAVNRSHFKNGATGAIIGAGPIGLLLLQAFKAAGGGKVICIDLLEKRLKIAKELGAEEVVNISDTKSELHEVADVIFETAGSAKASASLFKLARTGGCVTQIGWPRGNIVPMNIADFIDKELDYIGVNRYAAVFSTAITWVVDGRINVNKLITHKFTLDRISEAFRFTLENANEVIKTVVLNQ